jgi:hypothetical protein
VNAASITRGACSVARVGIFLFGLGAAAWGAYVFPSMQRDEPVERAASEILKGRDLQSRALLNLLAHSDGMLDRPICSPSGLRASATLRVALVKYETADGKAPTDDAYFELYHSVQAALRCSPSDAFMWVLLFWLDASRDGVTPKNSEFLQMSYASGPNEGWIGFWRVQVALPLLDRLSNRLSENAIDDFIKLLNTRILYNDLAAIVASETPGIRTRILASLKETDPVIRQSFAAALRAKGVDVAIPGVQAPDRPWH